MYIESSAESFRAAADEAVNSTRRKLVWHVFDRYEVEELDDGTDSYFYAPVDLPEGKRPHDLLISKYLRVPFMEDQGLMNYSPLNVPGLFLEFASLVEDPGLDDEPHTDNNEAEALRWISTWGVLGLTPTGFDSLTGRIHQGGKDDSLSSFVEQARFAHATLRLYEAATAPEDPDIDFILRGIRTDKRDYYARNPAEARKWALQRVGQVVGLSLEEHCYPTFATQDNDQAVLIWGFRNLLGAMWIQMMWLLTSTGKTRRCERPGCPRIITFESGQPPAEPGVKKNPRGKYKTRSDKKFCSALCRVKNYQQSQRQRNS